MKNIHKSCSIISNPLGKINLARFAAVAFFVGGLAGCITPSDLESEFAPSSNPQTVDQLQLDDKRAEIGARQHPKIVASYGGEYRDANALKMIARIVGVLTTVSENPIQSYRITILDAPSVNAFALPGGYLYITRGLLALANDEAEIAAVISHEMAHVIANHGIQRQQQQDAALIAGQVVSEILSGNLSTNSVLARNKLRLAAFSRQQELQADEIGIRMLAQAGYDPDASVRFLKSLENFSAFNAEDQTFSGLNFLSSHPSTPKRRAAAQKYADQFTSPSSQTTNRANFMRDINGLTFGDNAQHGYVRGNTFLHANLGIRFDVPDGFEIDNTSDAVLANGPNEIATQFDAVEIKAGSSLDSYINDGWIKGLEPSSIARTTINGLPALTARAQADRWIFDVTLIQYNEFYYRFLTAVPKTKARYLLVAKEIAGSFRALSQNEVANLRPLRIRTVQVAPGDTVSSIAAKMLGTNRKIELFRVLNALQSGATLTQGSIVKIVSE
jgi:predicted Zn-dependent protease